MLTFGSRMSVELERGLQTLGIDGFQHPSRLPWLALVVLAALLLAGRPRAPAIPWPGIGEARLAGARRFEALPWLAAGLRLLCLLCLLALMAEPVTRRRLPPEPGLGLDLVLVLDSSASMGALDTTLVAPDGDERDPLPNPRHTRFDLARRAVARFASRRVAEGDRLGLIVFGDTAFTQCPLTTDAELLVAALERVDVGVAGESTALGDALALAVVRASAAGGATARLVVLLTDGRSNAGEIPVSVAGELAAAAGVRVHTVGIGERGDKVAVRGRGAAGLGLRFERHDPDHETLRRVARATGGRFFAARTSADLRAVYEEIDALERGQRSLPARTEESARPEPLLAAAGSLLLLEIALTRLLGRRLP